MEFAEGATRKTVVNVLTLQDQPKTRKKNTTETSGATLNQKTNRPREATTRVIESLNCLNS